MKRVLAVMTVIAAFAMLNGCTKCSQEKPAEAPPVMEAPTAPAEGEMPPADPATPPPAEGTTPDPADDAK